MSRRNTSTWRSKPSEKWVALAGLLAVALSASQAKAAAKVTFEPTLEFGQGYSDNVGLGGTETESDSLSIVRLLLPVIREWQTGRMDFRYQPSFARYDERDELDRDEHDLRFRVRAEPVRGIKYGFSSRYRATQQQGEPDSTDDADLFISRRTDRQIAIADFTSGARIGPLWVWELGLGGTLYDYEAIEGFDDPSTDSNVEDRTETRGSVRFSRNLRKAGSNLGLQVAHSDFDLDVSPDASTDSVRLVYNKAVGRHAGISLAVGAYQMDSEMESQDTSGVDFNASLTRRYRHVALTLNGRSQPSSGGALRGASTNSLLGLTLAGRNLSAWSWRFSPRIAERDPNDPASSTRRTVAIGGEIGRRFGKHVRLRLRAQRVDQTDDSSGSADRETLSGEFSLQWFPRGGAESQR